MTLIKHSSFSQEFNRHIDEISIASIDTLFKMSTSKRAVNLLEMPSLDFKGKKRTSIAFRQTLDSLVDHKWNKTNENWERIFKDEFKYDSCGRIIEDIEYDMDTTYNSWICIRKYTTFYNDSGIVDSSIMIQRNDTLWEGGKNVYSYDSNGNLKYFVNYQLDDSAKLWNTSSKQEYWYNSDGDVLQVLISYWNVSDSSWINGTKLIYNYAGNKSFTERIWQYWNSENWIDLIKSEYYYDEFYNLTEQANYRKLNQTDSAFVPSAKYCYTYNDSRKQTSSSYFKWDRLKSAWKNSWKYEYNYDDLGNKVNEKYNIWRSSDSTWIISSKNEYIFDNNLKRKDILYPFDYYEFIDIFTHKVLEEISYVNDTSNNWNYNQRKVYYYTNNEESSINIGIDNQEVEIYPNPVSDRIQIHLQDNYKEAKIGLYDLMGRRVFSRQFTENESISMIGLPEGIYIYVLIIDHQIHTGKLIKK